MYAFSGVLAALYRRHLSGEGALVEVSLFEALSEWMGAPMYFTAYSGAQPARTGVEHATIAPYGPYVTADGASLVIAVQNDREWRDFCGVVLNQRALATDTRFATNSARVRNRDLLRAIISEHFARLRKLVALELLEKAKIASAEIKTVEQLVGHPVLAGRDRWRDVRTPTGRIKALASPGIPVGEAARMGPVPAVGQHTAEVLRELGLSAKEITELSRDGVISCAPAQPPGLEHDKRH
jgi:formyl-CoA transferase